MASSYRALRGLFVLDTSTDMEVMGVLKEMAFSEWK
jgi:hypothetical protein